MNKTIKKREQSLVALLTQACEEFKEQVPGFEWLTHFVDHSNFPLSLQIVCIFDTEQHQEAAQRNNSSKDMDRQIRAKLLKVGMVLKQKHHHVHFDNEQACLAQHQGNWEKRFTLYSKKH